MNKFPNEKQDLNLNNKMEEEITPPMQATYMEENKFDETAKNLIKKSNLVIANELVDRILGIKKEKKMGRTKH